MLALFVASAFGILEGSPSKFEANDGNMTANATGNADWNSVAGSCLGGANASVGNPCVNGKYVHVVDIAASKRDDSFEPGQKQDTACPVIVESKDPPKDDFTDIASFAELNTNSSSSQFEHTFLYGATIRVAPNGNASENVELNQGENGSCGTDPVTGVELLKRTPGDKLIAIDYLKGGTEVEFHVLTWVESGACFVSSHAPPCWGATVQTLSANAAEGKANQEAITVANNGISGRALAIGEFAEFGVDLTAAGIIPKNTCKAIPQAVWESRSSGSSFVSSTEDVEVEHHAINNCGEIKIIKHTNPRGFNQAFSYSSNLPTQTKGGVACTSGGSAGIGSDGSFCLNDNGNSGTANSEENKVDATALHPGEYTITEGAAPEGFEFGSVTCSGGTTTTDNSKQQAKVTLKPEDLVECVFVNNALGALKVAKVSSKSAHTALEGAVFSIKDPNGNTVPSSSFKKEGTGVICVDRLSVLGTYTVTEQKAPPGYALSTKEQKVEVKGNAAKCGDTSFKGASVTFEDEPLTEISATAKSEAVGGSSSTIKCTKAGSNVGNSPQSGESATVTAKELKPGTYTCELVIDP
jgi:prealbumin domain-containing protein